MTNRLPSDILKELSDSLAKEICEMKYLDPRDVSTKIKVRTDITVRTFLDSHYSHLEAKKNVLQRKLMFEQLPGWQKQKLQDEIQDLKLEIKQYHLAKRDFEQDMKIVSMRKFIIDKLGEQGWNEYEQTKRDF